jgi:hypothetical protein
VGYRDERATGTLDRLDGTAWIDDPTVPWTPSGGDEHCAYDHDLVEGAHGFVGGREGVAEQRLRDDDAEDGHPNRPGHCSIAGSAMLTIDPSIVATPEPRIAARSVSVCLRVISAI